ncbi:M48 family metalloprotease, partial [Bacillus cereus]
MTKGLLKTANEEELAGILAHELGHLKYGDSKRSVM